MPRAIMIERSCQFDGSSPGLTNGSMNVRSKRRPSRLESSTVSDNPSLGHAGSALRQGTKRLANMKYKPGARSYAVVMLVYKCSISASPKSIGSGVDQCRKSFEVVRRKVRIREFSQ